MTEFNALPDMTTVVPGGFHLNADAIERALKNCCSDLEAKAAGYCSVEMTDPAALRPQMLLDLPRTQSTIGGKFFDAVTYTEASTTFDERLRLVEDLVRSAELSSASQDDKPKAALRGEDRRLLAEFVLSHTCNTITNAAAKTAVQLVFGKAFLVLVKPSSDHRYQRASVIEVKKQQILVSVPSMWWLVEDAPTFGPIRTCSDLTRPLGVVATNYRLTLDLSTGNAEQWRQTLPTVEVQRCGTSNAARPSASHIHSVDASPATPPLLAPSSQVQPIGDLLRSSLGSLKSKVRKVRTSGTSAPPSNLPSPPQATAPPFTAFSDTG